MAFRKRTSHPVQAGSLIIGGNAPVSIQGMTKTKTADLRQTLNQIHSIQNAGADIIRLAIRDRDDLTAFKLLRKKTTLTLVADIHFQSELALGAIKAGADKIRLNPGNIKNPEQLKKIIKEAKKRKIAIRVGVNSGSLPPHLHPLPGGARSVDASHLTSPHKGEEFLGVASPRKGKEFNPVIPFFSPSPQRGEGGGEGDELSLAHAMVSAAKNYLNIFEAEDFRNLVVSLKSSSVRTAILANRIFRQQFDYPLHLGITESGRGNLALVKSAIGIGSLLEEGIGDTIRVSLSGPPEEEIEAGRQILQALGLRYFYPEIISCPTCGRCQVNLFKILEKVETGLKCLPGYPRDYAGIKIAVMGCEVNGPGEAAAADIGIAAGRKNGFLFTKGREIAKINEEELAPVLLREIRKLRKNRGRDKRSHSLG
ncbi:MAG: flavodoxin-dependent (E)-4-hydroxy-3-methylbut-2-enyl-diphosphate synthase [Candidatus Omnitrophica bacterium]|nr:flavodoxin-dependent (E)-4-hydroxy-3-methylbut-2-enyl-diphosphate synthase [Candidatus Omnitrophota bacterium]